MGIKDYYPTKRFSDRVENYVKYRLSYPKECIKYLNDEPLAKILFLSRIFA